MGHSENERILKTLSKNKIGKLDKYYQGARYNIRRFYFRPLVIAC